MAKTKVNTGVQNKIIYARASYLYQAANYLTSCANAIQDASSTPKSEHSASSEKASKQHRAVSNISRQALTDMRDVSLKAQIRQSQALKRTICKFCDSLLVESKTSRSWIENPSKGGRKPWADILVIECGMCGNAKRYPVDAPRQKRRSLRSKNQEAPAGQDEAVKDDIT